MTCLHTGCRVFLDTSCLRSFAEADLVPRLLSTFPETGVMAKHVLTEVEWMPPWREQRGEPLKWPSVVELTAEQTLHLELLAQLPQFQDSPDDDSTDEDRLRKNLGELATILVAQAEARRGRSVVLIMDDRNGRHLATRVSLATQSTADLVIDMVCATHLTPDEGWRVWCRALSDVEAQTAYPARLRDRCSIVWAP